MDDGGEQSAGLLADGYPYFRLQRRLVALSQLAGQLASVHEPEAVLLTLELVRYFLFHPVHPLKSLRQINVRIIEIRVK